MILSAENTTIGWIGTGVMGRWMCEHLMDRGYKTFVHNRTKAKAAPLLDAGAQWCDSPRQVAQNAAVIFTMLGYPEDVREVYFGSDGILAHVKKGAILVDMTTTEPSLAQKIASAAEARGVYAVDAPVSGGDVGARKGSLSIMVGGAKEATDSLRPLFEYMGKNIVHQGSAGSGQHTKMCNQITIASTMVGVCEALLYGYKAGVDLESVLASISKGAAACWTLDNLAPRILRRNFDPGFFVQHFIKDMGIALKEAQSMNLSLPGLALAHQLYVAVQAHGGEKLGTQALILALEQLSRIKWE